MVGFSLQYELTFTNVLTMLDLSGIPFRAADRDASHPLVIAGGPVATQPEPMAPFVDAFLIGDAEEKLPEMLLRVADTYDRDVQVTVKRLLGLLAPLLILVMALLVGFIVISIVLALFSINDVSF